MNIYYKVIKIAKDLQEEFGNKLTIAESLQIATQIQIAESIADGLQTDRSDGHTFLEAIAMSLGYVPEPGRRKTVADSLQMLVNKE